MSSMPAEPNLDERPLLERFTQALARILHDERPDALSRPITVAELYQDIAPYRRMRDLAGIEMHADYEHALIRLLAGEGGVARIDPDTAADALMIEAESLDPDLSVYRKFAACEVWLMPGERPEVMPEPRQPSATPDPPLLDRSSPRRVTGQAEAEDTPTADAEHRFAHAPEAPAPSGRPGRSNAATASRCGYCGHMLPEHREIRYCPFCGGDQTARQCGECGEALEQDWRFCVACGAAVPS